MQNKVVEKTSFCKQEMRIGLYLYLESDFFLFVLVVFMLCNVVERLMALEKYQITLFSPFSFFSPSTVFVFFHVAKSIFPEVWSEIVLYQDYF